jgi:hypothetical protein
MKKKEHDEEGLPFDGEFYVWDYRYYDRKYIETSLDLDDMLVKEYFPVSVVVPTILEIYQKLLGVRFQKIEGETWHPGALTNPFFPPDSETSHFQRLNNSQCGSMMQKMNQVSLAIAILIFTLVVCVPLSICLMLY